MEPLFKSMRDQLLVSHLKRSYPRPFPIFSFTVSPGEFSRHRRSIRLRQIHTAQSPVRAALPGGRKHLYRRYPDQGGALRDRLYAAAGPPLLNGAPYGKMPLWGWRSATRKIRKPCRSWMKCWKATVLLHSRTQSPLSFPAACASGRH